MTNEELVARIKNKIDVPENMLILWNQTRNYIHFMARLYKGNTDIEDLEQEGYLALYDAIEGYEVDFGCKFLTYAKHYIKLRMIRYIQNNDLIRIPVHLKDKISIYNKFVNDFLINQGRKPTINEIAKATQLPHKTIVKIGNYLKMLNVESTDRVISEDENITLGDTVVDDINTEEYIIEEARKEQLKAVLWPIVESLPVEQREVIKKRYQEEKTLKEIGELFNVSVASARQIEYKAIHNLRKPKYRNRLIDFHEEQRAYSRGISGTGLHHFLITWTSSTEKAAINSVM